MELGHSIVSVDFIHRRDAVDQYCWLVNFDT
jgi:hypothetical protein